LPFEHALWSVPTDVGTASEWQGCGPRKLAPDHARANASKGLTALARKYVRLAEDPDNEEYREQFLDLARVWMEVAIEEEGNNLSPNFYLDERERWQI
jgi:hypothetical protein